MALALEAQIEDIARRMVREELAKIPGGRRLVGISGAAEILGMSQAAIRNKVARGELRRVGSDRKYRFELRDLEKWIEGEKA